MPLTPEFTRREAAIIARCRTPRAVQQYLRTLPYNWENTLRTFREVVRHGRANCIEAALAAATILEQHGYPPLLLDLASVDKLDHVLFLFKSDGRWGSIGKSRDIGLHGRKPVFRSVRDLAYSYAGAYVDGSGRLVAYGVADLAAFPRINWRLSTRSVWAVEKALIDMDHTPMKTSDRKYRKALNQFLEFKAAHPGKPFAYPEGRHQWL